MSTETGDTRVAKTTPELLGRGRRFRGQPEKSKPVTSAPAKWEIRTAWRLEPGLSHLQKNIYIYISKKRRVRNLRYTGYILDTPIPKGKKNTNLKNPEYLYPSNPLHTCDEPISPKSNNPTRIVASLKLTPP
jgi:hypothetical protein